MSMFKIKLNISLSHESIPLIYPVAALVPGVHGADDCHRAVHVHLQVHRLLRHWVHHGALCQVRETTSPLLPISIVFLPGGHKKMSSILQCCGSGMFIPDPGSWFLPIPDPGSWISDTGSKNRNKREGRKKICYTFLCSHKFYKIENYFSFEMLKKKIWANFHRIIELFTQTIVTKLSKIWVWDPGVKRHRIPDPQHCYLGWPIAPSYMSPNAGCAGG